MQKSEIVPRTIKEPLLLYRTMKKNAMHAVCEGNREMCYAQLQTLHPEIFDKKVTLLEKGFPGSSYSYIKTQEILDAHRIIAIDSFRIRTVLYSKLELFPNSSEIYLWLGIAQENLGRPKEALEAYEKAMEMAKSYDWQPNYRAKKLRESNTNNENTL